MKRFTLLALPLFAACSAGAPSPAPIQQGLTLTTYTDKLISGVYDDGLTAAAIRSNEVADGIVVSQVTVGELVYTLTVDYNRGQLELVSPPAAANREQVAALHALEAELGFIAEDNANNVVHTLRAIATLLSEVAAGEVFPTVQSSINRSVVNIGCGNTCRTLYGGSCSPYKQTGQNSDNCKGRCGAGCDNARSGGNNKWTMDCAEHDYQIGPLGDVTDDVASASNVSCSGTGCFWATNCNSADGCANTAGGHGPSCR